MIHQDIHERGSHINKGIQALEPASFLCPRSLENEFPGSTIDVVDKDKPMVRRREQGRGDAEECVLRRYIANRIGRLAVADSDTNQSKVISRIKFEVGGKMEGQTSTVKCQPELRSY
ncbi:hypothetical protein NC651_028729 [Populus alba x Populus x berolinensis]|nr:hypothetical protein NC651_028729 [Populus alba x Populus x berolinensis]